VAPTIPGEPLERSGNTATRRAVKVSDGRRISHQTDQQRYDTLGSMGKLSALRYSTIAARGIRYGDVNHVGRLHAVALFMLTGQFPVPTARDDAALGSDAPRGGEPARRRYATALIVSPLGRS